MAAEGKNSDLWRAIREELVLPLVRWAVRGTTARAGREAAGTAPERAGHPAGKSSEPCRPRRICRGLWCRRQDGVPDLV